MIAGGSKCALANKECAGRLEWHHAVSQSRLKRQFPHGVLRASVWHDPPRWEPAARYDPMTTSDADGLTLGDILGDPRNRVWACSFHHEKITNHRVDVQLPESVWEFAAEFGLTAQLENDLARKNAA